MRLPEAPGEADDPGLDGGLGAADAEPLGDGAALAGGAIDTLGTAAGDGVRTGSVAGS